MQLALLTNYMFAEPMLPLSGQGPVVLLDLNVVACTCEFGSILFTSHEL